jgi:3-oxoacyl-[acyl-carrier-protein] synthase-3
MDVSDKGRSVAVIFGDGAGAVVVQATQNSDRRIFSTHLHADGRFAEELMVKDPGSSRAGRWISKEMIDEGGTDPFMNGNVVFKHAVIRFPEVIEEALRANSFSVRDIDLLIPHQANLRITNYVREKMGLDESKVFSNIHKYGNTTAASIPIAFSEAWEGGKIMPGSLVCLAAFGSGFTWAAALLKW